MYNNSYSDNSYSDDKGLQLYIKISKILNNNENDQFIMLMNNIDEKNENVFKNGFVNIINQTFINGQYDLFIFLHNHDIINKYFLKSFDMIILNRNLTENSVKFLHFYYENYSQNTLQEIIINHQQQKVTTLENMFISDYEKYHLTKMVVTNNKNKDIKKL